jgi:hypothetical protein
LPGALNPRSDTFPAEVLLELAAEAIAESGALPTEPIQYEGTRNRHLAEYQPPATKATTT